MKQRTLDVITPVLDVLRSHPALEETGEGEFAYRGRNIVHFHDGGAGEVFADALLKTGRVHMPVSTPEQQADFLARIDDALASLEARARPKRGDRR